MLDVQNEISAINESSDSEGEFSPKELLERNKEE
jgi:hypothetical protein